MPSKSRPIPSTHANVKLLDGWTFVGRAKGRRSTPSIRPTDQRPRDIDAIVNSQHVSRVIKDTEMAIGRWNASGCVKDLGEQLQKLDIRPNMLLCAGLGNLDPAVWLDNKRSLYQLASFLCFETFVKSDDPELKLYAHDPAFTATDAAVLEHYSVQVHTDEARLPLYSSSTFLFAPYLEWPLLARQYLNEDKPLVCVCQNLASVVETLTLRRDQGIVGNEMHLETAIGILELFLRSCEAFKFPKFEPYPAAFKDMMIYVRKQDSG